MKIYANISLDISNEEARQVCIDYLRSCIPYESEIRYDGLKKYWFTGIYDARGDKVIGYNKGKEVTKKDELISKLLLCL